MIRYESDESAVARVLANRQDGELIDAATARTIASWFNCPDAAGFVSTGIILMSEDDADMDDAEEVGLFMDAIRHGADEQTLADNADALTALEGYVTDRVRYGNTDPVSGWSGMWVLKHVDYPHEDGALDTCWCYPDDDDE